MLEAQSGGGGQHCANAVQSPIGLHQERGGMEDAGSPRWNDVVLMRPPAAAATRARARAAFDENV